MHANDENSGSSEETSKTPLSSSESLVGATRALGVRIEPDPQSEEIASQERAAADADAAGACGAGGGNAAAVSSVGTVPVQVEHSAALAERGQAVYQNKLEVFSVSSHSLQTALDETGIAATKLGLKLFEFAQANLNSSVDLACECARVRSLPDMFAAQAAYVSRQFKLLTEQLSEFQSLSADLAAKASAPFESQVKRTTQIPRV